MLFSGFDDDNGCPASHALRLENDLVRDGLLNNVQVFEGLSLDTETNRISVCDAVYNQKRGESKVQNVVIVGAGISPYGPGFYVKNNDDTLTTFLDGDDSSCFDVGGQSCLKFCPDACLCKVMFETSGWTATNDYSMIITDEGTGNTAVSDKHMFRWDSTSVTRKGYFGAALALGKSSLVSFLDGDGNVGWPKCVYDSYESQPQCAYSNSQQTSEVTLAYPPATARCDQLIYNGDLEGGVVDGWHEWGNAHLEVVSPGAEGSTYALSTKRRPKDRWQLALYYALDASCVRTNAGGRYLLTGQLHIRNSSGQAVARDAGKAHKCSPRRIGTLG